MQLTDLETSIETEDESGEDSRRTNANNKIHKSKEALLSSCNTSNLLYSINDTPPWYTCIILGIQHYLMMVEATVSIPFLLTPLMCLAASDPARGAITCTIIFISGLITLLQCSIGIRLPIVQGGTHGFIGPIMAILALMPCPSDEVFDSMTQDERTELWQVRMREVQGCICFAAIFQLIIGSTGAIGLILKWITPMVITPTIALIGFSLFQLAAEKAATNWPISLFTMALLILFSQYLGDFTVPSLSYSKSLGFKKTNLHIFKLFPVILAIGISWLLCFVLTIFDVLSPDDHARTDLRTNIISEAPWFRVPYPGQWGWPTASFAGILGMLSGVVASIVESVGDYYACARLSGAPPPPIHAINRGIFIEGVGTVLAGLWGSGTGTTSYSQNIGAIGVTKVGSRRVVIFSALVMIFFGVIGKAGAFFITIPEPIIGGMFFIVFAMITAVGLSSLQYIDLNSARNLFVLGFSLFFGLALPFWMQQPGNNKVVNTSYPMLDQIILVLLQTSMFVGGFMGFLLDNTIPGTPEERGLDAWMEMHDKNTEYTEDDSTIAEEECYNLPYVMDILKRLKWMKYVPISPTFQGWKKSYIKVCSKGSA